MMLPATMDVAQVCLAAWKSAACVRISFHNGLFRGYVSSKEGINNYILTYTFYRYIHPPEATPTSPAAREQMMRAADRDVTQTTD